MNTAEYVEALRNLDLPHVCFTHKHLEKLFELLHQEYTEWSARGSALGTFPVVELPSYNPTKSFEDARIDLEYIINTIKDARTYVKVNEQSICGSDQALNLMDDVAQFGITLETLDKRINEAL